MWTSEGAKMVWHDPREETANCYNEVYLADDTDILANMFEYCNEHAKKLWKHAINRDRFLNAFMRSYCREVMDLGHPRLSSQASIDTMQEFIESECNNSIDQFRLQKGERNLPNTYMYFWMGTVYAQLHFLMNIKSKDLIEMFPLEEAKQHYHLGHELGIREYCDRVIPLIKDGYYVS